MEELIAKAARQLAQSKYAVALTGAGMSTESGVPDFRGPDGVWTKNPDAERQAYASYYRFQRDPKAYWIERMTAVPWLRDMEKAKPNPGHRALAELEEMSVLKSIITQNIDNLHQSAGSSAIIELHGNAHYARCLACGLRHEFEEFRESFLEHGQIPVCRACGGLVKSATISFGQSMPEGPMERAEAATLDCDLFLVLGSSLVVYPAAGFPMLAKRNGARLVIVNREPTDQDPYADLVLHDEIGPVMSQVVGG